MPERTRALGFGRVPILHFCGGRTSTTGARSTLTRVTRTWTSSPSAQAIACFTLLISLRPAAVCFRYAWFLVRFGISEIAAVGESPLRAEAYLLLQPRNRKGLSLTQFGSSKCAKEPPRIADRAQEMSCFRETLLPRRVHQNIILASRPAGRAHFVTCARRFATIVFVCSDDNCAPSQSVNCCSVSNSRTPSRPPGGNIRKFGG